MLLQALVDYYELLSNDKESNMPKRFYGKANISYALQISKSGELVDVILLKKNIGKKLSAVPYIVPEPVLRSSGILPNFLCDNSSYVLGFDKKGKPKRSLECFEAFKELNISILSQVECEEALAVIAFLNNWNVETAKENPLLLPYIDDIYKGANFIFKLDGKTSWIHENEQIKKAWENYKLKNEGSVEMQCLVTGEKSPIAITHPVIKGIRGGQAMGNSLVNFNATAYESYGRNKAQGLNAPVSEYAAFAYTTALNYLLSNENNKMFLGDATIVFWAKSKSNSCAEIFNYFANPDKINTDDSKRDLPSEKAIKSIFKNISEGKMPNVDEDFDEDTTFYIVGLSPNAARISVRFFMENSFGFFMNNIAKHYKDLQIQKQNERNRDIISLWAIVNETVSKNATDKKSCFLLSGAVFRSILSGYKYPVALYNAILLRIRNDHDINYYRAAIIKAYLLRNCDKDNFKEVLTVSLNENSNNKSYVLGRLFAVLEKAQLDAIGSNLNSTIKDKYFSSACTTPAVVFPSLLKKSANHISKAEYGFALDKKIQELLCLLDINDNPLPKNLSYEEQGLFVLGYYHQKNSLYTKREEK